MSDQESDQESEIREKPSSKVYNEKIWTKSDGKIDGYVFKGKRSFGKALKGLKGIMKKGKTKEIGNVKFKTLDAKEQGSGIQMDVQVTNHKDRGNAILKVYGPKEDGKKYNSVTISKCKESDSKFIVILAEKVIKPLMDKFLSGDMKIVESSPENSDMKLQLFKCSFCEKVCKTSAGLKVHSTRMHLDDQGLVKEEETNKRKINEKVNEVVESLLEEVVNISDEEYNIEEIVNNDNGNKKYTKTCQTCGFQIEAEKKYISLQKIEEHRNTCGFNKTCPQCDGKLKDQVDLKKHMRDEHGIMTASTSPPFKKKKVDFATKLIQENASETKLNQNDNSIEDMDIDKSDDQDDVLMIRSKRMDEKVIAKQKKIDEEVQTFLDKKVTSEEKKQKDEKKVTKSINKKSLKSKTKKHTRIKLNMTHTRSQAHNLRDVPDECKHLVNDDDVVYVVPGDGACGPNSAAAHLFEDEVFGSKLRKQMNIFCANQFHKRYK